MHRFPDASLFYPTRSHYISPYSISLYYPPPLPPISSTKFLLFPSLSSALVSSTYSTTFLLIIHAQPSL